MQKTEKRKRLESDEKQKELNKQKEKETKDPKRKRKINKEKEQITMKRRVSPRRSHTPTEKSSTSAVRTDLIANTTSYSESTTLIEQIMERQAVRGSPRTPATHPGTSAKNSAKQAVTTPSVTMKTPSVRALGLAVGAEVHPIGKGAKALAV